MSHLPEPVNAPNRPCCVPTLTEVVEPSRAPEALAARAVRPDGALDEMHELMVRRVLQRIDQTLERRLHDAVEQLILEHTATLMPRIRDEIELVVRECVTQAFEQEAAPLPASLAVNDRTHF